MGELESGFTKKLSTLNSTQLSIESLSKWLDINELNFHKHLVLLNPSNENTRHHFPDGGHEQLHTLRILYISLNVTCDLY
jgi:hypothetical protein